MLSSHVPSPVKNLDKVDTLPSALFQPLPLYRSANFSAFIYKNEYLFWMHASPESYQQLFALVRKVAEPDFSHEVSLEPAQIKHEKIPHQSLLALNAEKQQALACLDQQTDERLEEANKEYELKGEVLNRSRKRINQLANLRTKLPGGSPHHHRISSQVQDCEKSYEESIGIITQEWREQRKKIRRQHDQEVQKIEQDFADRSMKILHRALHPVSLASVRAHVLADMLKELGLAGENPKERCQIPNSDIWNLIFALQNVHHHRSKSPISLTKSLLSTLAQRNDLKAQQRLEHGKRTWISSDQDQRVIRCYQLPLRKIEEIFAFWQLLNKHGSWADNYWLEHPQDLLTLKKDIVNILLNHQVPAGENYVKETHALMNIQEHVRQYISTRLASELQAHSMFSSLSPARVGEGNEVTVAHRMRS